MDDTMKTAASLALLFTIPAAATSAQGAMTEQALTDMIIEPAPGAGGGAALAAFADENVTTRALRFSPEPEFDMGLLSFEATAAIEDGPVGVAIENGQLVTFVKRDVEQMPDTFLTPLDPEAPAPLTNDAASLTTPLPGAAPLLFGGLAAFGFATRRKKTEN